MCIRDSLKYFDFKVSKVAKKSGRERVPYNDRIFLYVMKNSRRYAFITPEWVFRNGEVGVVPAWGSRQAYRVPREKFESILKEDRTLKPIIESIEAKVRILNFQSRLITIWQDQLSSELQKAIDEDKVVKIIPGSLESFFKVCFILDHLQKVPENLNLWLIYLLSYVNIELKLREIAMLIYSLDFLYSKIIHLERNELRELENKIKMLLSLIDRYYEGGVYKSSIEESALEETRYALFSISLLEDIIQDSIYYHNSNLSPIRKIFQYVKDVSRISELIINY